MEGGWKDITAVVVVEKARLLLKEMDPTIRKGKRVLRHYVQILWRDDKGIEECFHFINSYNGEGSNQPRVRIREH